MTGGVLLLLLVSAACVFSSIIIDDLEVQLSWEKFKKDNNKVYANKEDHDYRRSVFEKELQKMMVHNMAYDRGDETYTQGINKWADMTTEEWLRLREISCDEYKPPSTETEANRSLGVQDMLAELGDPPSSRDWSNVVSDDVRNQNVGACGGCYAFAATSVVESMYMITKNLTGKSNVPILSEQEIIDCGFDHGCNGCKGGHPCSAYDTIKAQNGLATAAEYPWSKTQDNKKDHCIKKQFKNKVQIQNYYKEINTATNRDYNLQVMVGLRGPATASLCVNEGFKKYSSGIFRDDKCYNTCILTRASGINHSVLAYKYNADSFWIRNSWGKGWGLDGNMRIARQKTEGDNGTCGLGKDVSQPIIKLKLTKLYY